MSAAVEAYPLSWPMGWRRTAPGQRKGAQFHGTTLGTYTTGGPYRRRRALTTTEAVERVRIELERMDARGITVSTNVPLRRDGQPHGGAREPDDPGVSVYWSTPAGQPRCMAIDKYDRVADNLAAVAGTLAALRAVERYGGALILERAFQGFQALPEVASQESWSAVLQISPEASLDEVKTAYRQRALECHPDRGGSHDAMTRVSAAYQDALRALQVTQ